MDVITYNKCWHVRKYHESFVNEDPQSTEIYIIIRKPVSVDKRRFYVNVRKCTRNLRRSTVDSTLQCTYNERFRAPVSKSNNNNFVNIKM